MSSGGADDQLLLGADGRAQRLGPWISFLFSTGVVCTHRQDIFDLIDCSRACSFLKQMLSVIFSACTRLRRIFLLLPEALARTQPDCLSLVHAHFASW